jgi:hypothetical protein
MVMGFGFSYGGGGGGDFLPIAKYDARAGRVFRVDKEDGVSTQVDITRNFTAVFDFENIEGGWIRFNAGSAPDFVLAPIGQPLPDQPSPDHRKGVRVLIKLSKECGGDVREVAGTASVFMNGLEAAYDQYLEGVAANPGKLPVMSLKDTVPVETNSKTNKSTNYRPVFEITGWVKRPADLVAKPRGAGGAVAEEKPKSPPSTGSTKVAPPKAAAKVAEDDDDFG